MIFLLQFTVNQTTYTRMMGAEYAVRSFRQTAESTQEIDDSAVQDLKLKLAAALRCGAQEVTTEVSDDGTYRVSAPVRGVIGAASALGIRPDRSMPSAMSRWCRRRASLACAIPWSSI